MACTVWLVLLVAATKIHPEKQALLAGTKQSNQAERAVRAALSVSVRLLCFVPATSALVLLKWMFHKLICVEQSTFSRYL
jgi:hypothetical protein